AGPGQLQTPDCGAGAGDEAAGVDEVERDVEGGQRGGRGIDETGQHGAQAAGAVDARSQTARESARSGADGEEAQCGGTTGRRGLRELSVDGRLCRAVRRDDG